MNIISFRKKLNKQKETLEISAESSAKKRAEKTKQLVIESIQLGYLKPKLKKNTVKRKQSYSTYPEHPLYGLGEENGKSMIRGLRVRKIKNGWRVAPEGSHHSGLSMQAIYGIHEFGATLSNGGKIPARKPIRTAVNNFKKLYSEKYTKEEKKNAKNSNR